MRGVRIVDGGVACVEVPEPEGDGVVVHVRSSGVCGSDLHMLAWGLPVTLGHEVGGTLDDGTPVSVWPLDPCGTCDRCLVGEVQQCRTVVGTIYGVGRDGGMADRMHVAAHQLVRLPAGLDPSDACLVEPLACSVHAFHRAGLTGGQRVAVVGGGSIGLGAVAAARWAGADVSLVARHDAQRRAGERLGARIVDGTLPGGDPGYDVVVDAAGTTSALATVFGLLHPGATVVLVASYWDPVELPLFFSSQEPVMIGATTHGRHAGGRDIDVAAALLAANPEVARAVISHRFPLADAAEAFRVAGDRAAGAIKVVLEP